MITPELLDYIKQQRSAGRNEADIRASLHAAGWPEPAITEALGANAPAAVPAYNAAAPSGSLPSIGILFADSFALFKRRFGVMILSGLLLMGCILGAGIIGLVIWLAVRSVGGGNTSVAAIVVAAIFGLAILVAYIYAILWMASAFIVALRDDVERTGVIENLKRSRKLIWGVFLVNLIMTVVTMGGFVLFIIPGIILSIYYSFASIIRIVEDKKGRMALAQSKAYVKNRWWKVFGRTLLLNGIYFLLYIGLSAISSGSKNTAVTVLASVLSFALQVFFSIYSLAFSYTLYQQLRSTAGPTQPENYVSGVTGWTVWGALGGVFVFLGLLTSIVLLSLNSARVKSRDALRVSQIRQISSALELYANYHDLAYPVSLNDTAEYFQSGVPTAPKPADGTCTDEQNAYTYKKISDISYEVTFCLGQTTGGYASGVRILTEAGIQ